MNIFLENTFSLNNHISISDKIKRIPLYFVHFFPIDRFKNLDSNYKHLPVSSSNTVQREIKYKIIYFKDIDSNITPVLFNSSSFSKALYHVFVSASILHEKHISFTIHSTEDPVFASFIQHDHSKLPLLNNFSLSFHFPSIRFHNMKLYFSRDLLTNPYIPFEVFLITYLLHNNVGILTPDIVSNVQMSFRDTLCKYMKSDEFSHFIQTKYIENKMDSFVNHDASYIINHLLISKYTWTYYSLCLYFRIHHKDLLHEYTLCDLFEDYIQAPYEERNLNIITDIYNILFTNIKM